jgi:hypothetical protein
MLTNWYIENNTPPALGMAVMLLGGGIQQLEESITADNVERIKELLIYNQKIANLYVQSLNNSEANSLIAQEYRNVGAAMNQKLIILANLASKRLVSSMKLVKL